MTMSRRTFSFGTVGVLAALGPAAPGARAEGPAAGVKIVRKSPALDALIAKDAVVEKLADGYQWTEGPVWDKANGRLLFSDIPGNRIIAWAAGKGASEWLKPSGYTGTAPFTGSRAGLERPRLRRPGPPDPLPARGPADRPPRGLGQVHDPGRPL